MVGHDAGAARRSLQPGLPGRRQGIDGERGKVATAILQQRQVGVVPGVRRPQLSLALLLLSALLGRCTRPVPEPGGDRLLHHVLTVLAPLEHESNGCGSELIGHLDPVQMAMRDESADLVGRVIEGASGVLRCRRQYIQEVVAGCVQGPPAGCALGAAHHRAVVSGRLLCVHALSVPVDAGGAVVAMHSW